MKVEDIQIPDALKSINGILNQLIADGEKAARLCHEKHKDFPRASVNWADFHCVGAELVYSTMYEPPLHWSICIEEASPNNWEITKFISSQLEEKWGFVKVVTEW